MTEKMKPSGITWIGDIPENWKAKKLRFILDENGIKVGPFGSSISSSDYCDEGKWVYNQRTVLDDEFSIADACISEEKYREMIGFKVNAGDMLITSRGTIGKVAIVPEGAPEGILHPCIIKFSIDKEEVVDRLIKKVFNETDFIREQLGYLSNATTIEVIYSYTLKDVYLPIAPINEQRAIADFLDAQCAKIDSVIADIEKQIETLQKYKKSLIIETITNRKANWKYGRIKDLMTLQRGHDLPQEEFVSGNVPVYGSNGVIGYHNIPTTAGPCVTIGRSGSVGALNYVNCDFWAHNTAIFIANSKGNHIRYLYYVLQSFDIKELANGSAVPTLDRKKVEGVHLYFTLDPIEQREIANYLDARIAKFNEIIDVKQLQLETIRQHKKSLIYEYVTGKKRVTEVN